MRLSLLAVRLGALTHCLVHLDMARDAQALDVVWVEAQPLHLLDAHGRADRSDMVAVDSGSHISLTLTLLAERVCL